MCVIPDGRATCLLYFHCCGLYYMGGVLEGINQDKRKYDTSLNSREGPLSLEDSWKPASVSIVMSDNPGSECNNNIV